MVDISIIVISYNHEKYISETLESLLRQNTQYKMEILIGDDCSKDNTLKIIKEYEKKFPDKIKNIERPQNLGATGNLYDLILRAKGRYIAFCEGDDYWSNDNRLQYEIDFLEKNEDFYGICGKTQPVDENGVEIPIEKIAKEKRFWLFDRDEYTLEDFRKWLMPGHFSALTIRNIGISHRDDCKLIKEAHAMVGDRTIALLAALHGRIKCYGDISSFYRFRLTENNFMSKMENNNLRLDDFNMIVKMEEYVCNNYIRDFSLENMKLERLIGATVVNLKNKNETNKEVLKSIINTSGKKLKYSCYVIYIVAVKLFYWKILKKDKRIEIGEGKR